MFLLNGTKEILYMHVCVFSFFHFPTADFLHCFTILKLECNSFKVKGCALKDKMPLQLLIERKEKSTVEKCNKIKRMYNKL